MEIPDLIRRDVWYIEEDDGEKRPLEDKDVEDELYIARKALDQAWMELGSPAPWDIPKWFFRAAEHLLIHFGYRQGGSPWPQYVDGFERCGIFLSCWMVEQWYRAKLKEPHPITLDRVDHIPPAGNLHGHVANPEHDPPPVGALVVYEGKTYQVKKIESNQRHRWPYSLKLGPPRNVS